MLVLLLFIILAGIIAAFTVIILAANIRRLRVARAAATARDEQLQAVFRAMTGDASAPVQAALLCRTNRPAGRPAVNRVAILPCLPDFPWAGKSLLISVGATVEAGLINDDASETQLAGKVYQPVGVPCLSSHTGELRNCFSPGRCLADNPALRQTLTAISPRYPRELLSYLLCIGTENIHYEAIDQARLGGEAAWMRSQDPLPVCPHCDQPLQLILQLPGSVLGDKRHHEATFYWLGCRRHADEIQLVAQYA